MPVDIGGTIGAVLPTKESLTQSFGSLFIWITIFIVIVIVLVVGAVLVYILIRRLQFFKIVEIYEETEGRPLEYVGIDRAKELTYNIYGDSVYVLLKRKKFLPRAEIKVSRRRYLYCIGKDGEWVNFGLESLNAKKHEAGVKFVHPDMRAFKSGTAKIIKDSYQKKSIIKEYLPVIIPLVMFIVICIALYFIVDRIVASENNLIEMSKTAAIVMDKAKEVLTATSNICTGGTGYK